MEKLWQANWLHCCRSSSHAWLYGCSVPEQEARGSICTAGTCSNIKQRCTRSQRKHLHRWNLQQHKTKMQFLVLFTASNNWQRDLAAFDNMVLSSAAVSRLPWRRGGTIYLSRLASNITVPTFCYNNIITPNCSCILENKVCWVQISSMLPISLYVQKFRNFHWREIIMDFGWVSSMTRV